jgi:hypothetical protein
MNRTARAVMLTQMLCAALLATTSFGYDIDDKGILLRNAKWDYIDTAGRVVIEPQFEGASPFFEGVAHVEENNNETGHWGYVDTAGRPAFANKRVSAPFRNGRAWAQIFNPGDHDKRSRTARQRGSESGRLFRMWPKKARSRGRS